jgi:hypothetical protein
MDNVGDDPYDLVNVLSRLEGFQGIGCEIGRGPAIDDGLGVTASGPRKGLFQKLLRSLRSRRSKSRNENLLEHG